MVHNKMSAGVLFRKDAVCVKNDCCRYDTTALSDIRRHDSIKRILFAIHGPCQREASGDPSCNTDTLHLLRRGRWYTFYPDSFTNSISLSIF